MEYFYETQDADHTIAGDEPPIGVRAQIRFGYIDDNFVPHYVYLRWFASHVELSTWNSFLLLASQVDFMVGLNFEINRAAMRNQDLVSVKAVEYLLDRAGFTKRVFPQTRETGEHS